MEILLFTLAVLYYGFGIACLVYEAIHNSKRRHQEKKLEENLDNLNKLLSNTKFLEK